MLKPSTVSFCVALLLAACQQNASPIKPTATGAQPATPPSTSEPASAATAEPAPAADNGATAPAPAADGNLITTQWKCGNQEFTATFDKTTNNLEFGFAGKKLVLPSAISASGARFADGDGNEFWEHQGEATLTFAGKDKAVVCTRATSTTP
ncbi:MAG: MliC family protein [Xanthomonadaceae bacterium]|jgi:membrane-bound inhibitor of C-type lysozyme|nr:MliC family protein [Xanthomonadaceae bacterium]